MRTKIHIPLGVLNIVTQSVLSKNLSPYRTLSLKLTISLLQDVHIVLCSCKEIRQYCI